MLSWFNANGFCAAGCGCHCPAEMEKHFQL
jgi:hypothetical protein